MNQENHRYPVLPSERAVRRPRRMSRRAVLRKGSMLAPVLLVGLVATRLRLFTGIGRAPAARAQPACVITPQLTEGPYFVDEKLFRSDIRSDPASGEVKQGVPVRLGFHVLDATGGMCGVLAGATVDVWHCDALGVYSDSRDPGFTTIGQRWLRGTQYTDANGYAEFLTIYPGWYQGRSVHIHFKVRTDPNAETGYEFTSQLFFDDALTDVVHARPPYAAKGFRTLRNDGDDIYRQSGGALTLAAVPEGEGYAAVFDVGVDRSAPPSPTGPGGPPPFGPGRPPPGGSPPLG